MDALLEGGYVIYFRHAATDFSQLDTNRENLRDCRTQRNLTGEGRAQARAIGQGFRALRVPVGEVLSSQYCRTRQTAELAFGRARLAPELTGVVGIDDTERDRRTAALRRLLSTSPRDGTNTVLVGHLFNLQDAADVSIAEGEAAVVQPLGDGGFRLVARVLADEWLPLSEGPQVGPAVRATQGSSVQLTPTQASEVELEEYPVPEGSHPHDVAPAPDGSVWYTAQATGEFGRLDPQSGETRHIQLGAGSAPHGVIIGPDEAPWITDSGLNAIVRVDPDTEKVQRFPLPEDAGYANLNTATFDRQGLLWFTGQSGVYGRLDPQNGRVEMYDAPRGPGPYGITTTPDGDVYYASLAGNHIARVDPDTGTATVIEPPTAEQGARRVWSDSEGRVWVSEYLAGQVGMYDPRSGEWREWRLPGDTPQAYAVYVDDRDMVWLSDFGGNALVRFDPTTEQFTVFPLPSPSGNVRQILGRPGEVWGAESGADKLVVVRVP